MKTVSYSVDNINTTEKEVFMNIYEIVELSDKVAGETQGILAAAEEQVASIEEMTASAQSFSEMSVILEALTNKFKTK